MGNSVLKTSFEPGVGGESSAAALLARYENAARSGGEGLWDWDLVSGDVWYSPVLKGLLGWNERDRFPNTFAGFQQYIHADHRTFVIRGVRQHLEQHHPLNLEFQMHTRSGALRWFNLKGAAQRDPSGHPLRLSGSLSDSTERRRGEDVVRHAEDLQRRALDALHVAVGVLNSKGEIVEINRTWREFDSDAGLIGMRFSFGEDYPGLCEKAMHRCSEGNTAALGIRAVLEGRRNSFSMTYKVVHRGESGDAPRERHYELRAHAFVDGHSTADESRGVFVIHMDVSETREAYAALEESRDFYERILNAIPIQISYVDKDRRILYMNRAYEHWFQLPLAAIRGRRVEEINSVERQRSVAPRIEAVLAGKTVEFEEHASRADGVERELAVNYVAHRDMHEDVVGFLSIVRDVTEQKRLEASLRQSQKMEAVGQLTGGIAHDFNNMLSVIIGNLQLLERPLRGHERLLKQVRTALRAALGGAELTRRLLAFARQTTLEPRVVDPNALIEGMHELLRRSLGREIEILPILAQDPWPVRVDPSQLENCLLNLGINARDAMPKGGTLTIETRNISVDAQLAKRHPQLRVADYLTVAVIDTGAGMSREVLKRAFEPFFTTKEVGKGTGLGLSMVYSFLEQSGGVAVLQSEPDIGTTVRLYFPRAVAPSVSGVPIDKPLKLHDPNTAFAGGAVAMAPRGTEIVLVVEDDADVRTTAVGALRSFGYQVLEAGTAADAMRVLESDEPVDLLFTDITLPGGFHGPALAQHAQALRPQLKVLYTSGFSESVVIRRGILDGSLPMIPKPYAILDLALRVRTALGPASAAVPSKE